MARVVEKDVCSLRKECRYLDLHRSSHQYRARGVSEKAIKLVCRIVWLSRKYPRYGYRRIRALLDREGWRASRKFVQRIRRLEGLEVKGKAPRRRRRGTSTAAPTQASGTDEVWSWDFVHDRTENGAPLKMLTMIDECTRQCLKIEVGRKLRGGDVLDALSEVMAQRGVPNYIRSDNGSESQRSGDSQPAWLPEGRAERGNSWPKRFSNGWRRWGSKPSRLIQGARGRTGMSRASTIA